MQGMMGYLIAVIFILLIGNSFFFYRQYKRNRKPVVRSTPEEKAVVYRDHEIQRRFDREQAEAAKQVELRNKTLALYEQVRKNAEAAERQAALAAGEKSAAAAGEGTGPGAGAQGAAGGSDASLSPEGE